uniref:Uncharacterized protein n=1 Tax=Leersia perrieri TaxID=77586 RepID=A0A0D9V5T4_9ORYZ
MPNDHHRVAMHDVSPSVDALRQTLQRQIRPCRNHAGVLRRFLKATHKNHRAIMARKAEVRALAAAVEGTNAVALAAPAPVPPPPSPACPPRRRIADTVVRAMRSSPPVFVPVVLTSPTPPPPSPELRSRAAATEGSTMTALLPEADGVWIVTEDTSSEESSPA